ncbi:hypothetical protein F4825DRAFT_400426 [Nemania diffusa]|nr:hypothetical protein F4825DRAFT_400426 [Nemania diffusa]
MTKVSRGLVILVMTCLLRYSARLSRRRSESKYHYQSRNAYLLRAGRTRKPLIRDNKSRALMKRTVGEGLTSHPT